MTFDEAVKKSIKSFMQGKMPTNTSALKNDGLFYTPEFFDDLEEQLLSEDVDMEEEIEDEA